MSIRDAAQSSARKTDASKNNGEQIRATLARTPYRANQRWSFGFRFFKEIKNFGLDSGKIDKKWPLSLIYRLHELSELTVASVMEDISVRDGTLRIHNLNWEQKNIPIKRSDLNWITDDFLNNEEEFPLFQIAVSKAAGRFVGFLDEDNVFQVVLLDPLHNAQPSKFNDYKVRLCQPLGCEVTSIRHDMNLAIKRIQGKTCGCEGELASALEWTKAKPGMAVVMTVVEGTAIEDAEQLFKDGVANSYLEIFETGLVAMLEK